MAVRQYFLLYTHALLYTNTNTHTRSTTNTCCFSVFVPILFLYRIIEATRQMTYHRKSVCLAFYCTYISFNTLTIQPFTFNFTLRTLQPNITCTSTRTHELHRTFAWQINHHCAYNWRRIISNIENEKPRIITKMKQ